MRLRPSRDKDYRGVKTTVDWSHLVHMVRTRKPGALEVLQDAINEWFPRQFEEAKRKARAQASGRKSVWVAFDSRIARKRFSQNQILSWQLGAGSAPIEQRKARYSTDEKKRPFFIVGYWAGGLKPSEPLPQVAIVYKATWKGEISPRVERKALRPNYTGSYKRAKIPVLHYELRENDELGPEALFVVRGKGAAAWAKQRGTILGTRWEANGTDFAYAAAILGDDNHAKLIREIRRDGYRNKLNYHEFGVTIG